MKQTITQFTFAQAFKNMGRQDQFTLGALNALFEYYEELEADCDTEIEFDCIAICCDWSEYRNPVECMHDYGFSCEIDADNGEETDEQILEHLQDNTQVIEFNGGILVASF